MGEPKFRQGSLTVPGAAFIRLDWDYPNLTIGFNVIGAIIAGGTIINQALANSLGASIKSAFSSSGLASHVTNQAALNNIGVRDIRTASLPEFVDTGAAVTGGATGDALPGGNAVVVSLKTALAGPSYRGRVYLGGFTETDNTSTSAINAALGAACVSFVQAVQTAMAGQGLTMAVISRPHLAWDAQYTIHHNDGTDEVQSYAHKGRPGQANAVQSIILRNAIWDSQRRRTSAGGGSTRSRPLITVNAGDDSKSGPWAAI